MDAQALISNLAARGIALIPDGSSLIARPRERLTEADRERIRQHKADLLDLLRIPSDGRAAWTRSVAPDSRHPLIPPEARCKIEAIEAEARAKGWPAELLWNSNFWDRPRGLAAMLDREDEIVEVATDYIAILKVKRDLLRFRRHVA
jgi:TubC N-terminal docking domain